MKQTMSIKDNSIDWCQCQWQKHHITFHIVSYRIARQANRLYGKTMKNPQNIARAYTHTHTLLCCSFLGMMFNTFCKFFLGTECVSGLSMVWYFNFLSHRYCFHIVWRLCSAICLENILQSSCSVFA